MRTTSHVYTLLGSLSTVTVLMLNAIYDRQAKKKKQQMRRKKPQN